jgi:hypothetical protein
LLDRALAQLGWSRDAVYVSNAVKHFKFTLRGKRRMHKTPAQREAAACLHWLEDEIALVQRRSSRAGSRTWPKPRTTWSANADVTQVLNFSTAGAHCVIRR